MPSPESPANLITTRSSLTGCPGAGSPPVITVPVCETKTEVRTKPTGVGLEAAFNGLQQHLRHVPDLHVRALVLALPLCQPISDHHSAEGAAGHDFRRVRAERLVYAFEVDALANVLLHPH